MREIRETQQPQSPEALYEQLQLLYRQLTEKFQQQWDRSLPFEELLVDRWQRAKTLGFGEGSSIYSNSLVFGQVEAEEQVWIGPYTILDGSGGKITIGAHCDLSAGTQLYTHDSIQRVLSAGKLSIEKGDISIGTCTYLGPNTIVQRDVSIGDHCIIGASSMVNRSIPPYSFAAGIPCRVLGRVVPEKNGRHRIEMNTK